MKKANRQYLAEIAREKAQLPFHGYIEGKESNLEPIIRHFPKKKEKANTELSQ